MPKHGPRRTTPMTVQSTCIDCKVKPQTPYTKGTYRSRCKSCHRKRFPADKHRNRIKKRNEKFKKPHCEKCGFNAVHPCQLDIDHIDGNRNNWAEENIQTLCANCHRLKTITEKNYATVYPSGARKRQ